MSVEPPPAGQSHISFWSVDPQAENRVGRWVVGEGPFPQHTLHGPFKTRQDAEAFAATLEGETDVSWLTPPDEAAA